MKNTLNLELLQPTKHMFEWLAENPFEKMLTDIEGLLKQQVNDATVASFEATSKPHWLSGGAPSETDSNKVILVRAGVAFEFMMRVVSEGREDELVGVYSWVAKDMNSNFNSRIWLDLDGTLEEFGNKGALLERIY